MIIAGFQPLSLIDYPGKSCSIVFTQGCPFRCPYCHNPELISTRPQTTISEESVLTNLKKNARMLDGVTITGGEPTIQVGLRRFIEEIRALGLLIKLDSNGIHPELIRSFLDDGLVDFIAMDLKHRWEKYQDIVRSGGEKTVENCRQTFEIIQQSGIEHEFRTTICPGKHTEDDFIEMASYLKDDEHYTIQQTQFTKTLDTDLPREGVLSAATLVETLRDRFPRLVIESR